MKQPQSRPTCKQKWVLCASTDCRSEESCTNLYELSLFRKTRCDRIVELPSN